MYLLSRTILTSVLGIVLVSLVVIILYPVINNSLYLSEFLTPTNINLTFHMVQKVFLRCIVPAVRFSWHRLPQIAAFYWLNKTCVCIIPSDRESVFLCGEVGNSTVWKPWLLTVGECWIGEKLFSRLLHHLPINLRRFITNYKY